MLVDYGLNPDLVIVGNAYSRGNEEIEFLLDSREIPFASLSEAMNRFVSKRRNLVITKTWKTTTTALAAYLLEKSVARPGYLIGGAPIDPESGWNAGSSDGPFVIEGDEYDSAFSTSGANSSIIRRVAVVNNLSSAMPTSFGTWRTSSEASAIFAALFLRTGTCLLMGTMKTRCRCFRLLDSRVEGGRGEHCDLRIERYKTTLTGSRFDLSWKGKPWRTVDWMMAGKLFSQRSHGLF